MKKLFVTLLALGFVFAAGAAEAAGKAKESVLLEKKFSPEYRWNRAVYIHGAKGIKNPAEIKALAKLSYTEKGAVLETDAKLSTLKDANRKKIYLSNNITKVLPLPADAADKTLTMSFDVEGKGRVQLIAVVLGKKGDKAFKTQVWSMAMEAKKQVYSLKRKLPAGAARVVCYCRLDTPGKLTVKSVKVTLQ